MRTPDLFQAASPACELTETARDGHDAAHHGCSAPRQPSVFLARQPGAAALSCPARGDMDWTKLTKRHPDRPGGSAGMIAGIAAKQRLAGEAPGTWTLDPKL